ncbi:rho guanine nucleotide exchange factor 18 isoform X2 [Denticeps clupeoides]|uniref:Rho guanine nucleotide exchange factor 18-like n=1 Tax=Denticeps clupeoides TaxID=299321 RepID=A0AAY4DPP0_9TELE|nr:rho guanine nucleotide exchange factor 18-like isoform X2 [Denticeps clupeoides]
MADSPLNNSWPSFSKLWMKRWSFKRGSECKPCTERESSDAGSYASLSPASIAEDAFFSSLAEERNDCSTESDHESTGPDGNSSTEDLLHLNLKDSVYYKDLQAESAAPATHLSVLISPVGEHQFSPTLHVYQISDGESYPISVAPKFAHSLQPNSNMDTHNKRLQDSTVTVTATVDLNGPEEDLDTSSDNENVPLLVRSMSTSRRHSWEVPVSPFELGRRLSLDTREMDSDGEREEFCLSKAQHQHFVYPESHVPQPSDRPGRALYSRSDILATDVRSRAARVSRILETSKLAARAAGEEHDLEDSLQSAEGQSHIANRRNSSPYRKASSGNVTWYEFLSNENEEEDDRAEKSERGTKVKRTLSSLKNRMTGSFNKDKGKSREKEHQKEKGKERELKDSEKTDHLSISGHHLVPGSFSICATCSLCSKSLQKKHGLQCQNCAVNVHKSCRNLLPECSSSKNKFKDPLQKSCGASQISSQALKEQPCSALPVATDGFSRLPCTPGMTITPRGASAQPAATSNAALSHNSSSGSISGEMDETDAGRFKRFVEDTVSLAPSSTESILEDAHYTDLRAELEADAHDFELESWSLAVDQQYLRKHSKETIKRQDVIYELIQTEVHHVRTLKVMLRVYARELREILQAQEQRVDCLFPRLDSLLEVHSRFLSSLKERRLQSQQPGSDYNYSIQRLGDILITQFSGEIGERLKESYGDFCSHHNEAVSFYKEQLQSSKKFQSLIKKISNLSIVRRLTVPECILLVTQRITKYPVLVERILQNTEAGTEEHEELSRALALIKDSIMQVDTHVNDYKNAARLRDIAGKMELKSLGRIKGGRVFRREDLCQGRRKLLYEGTVNWKAASGRLKEILAILLTDVLLLLQEKDSRFAFSTVDNKPSVISLQKLIVREVAHEEKAMFLICASSNEPEMYEIHTNSKEERNIWITQIRQAVENCPHTEERLFSEEEEARASRIKEFHERLTQKDAQIVQSLTEKLELFADVAASLGGLEDAGPRARLLLHGDASDLQQGEMLLKGAITEVENLQNLLLSGVRGPTPWQGEGQVSAGPPRRADTFGGYDSSPSILQKNGNVKSYIGAVKFRERSQRASSDPQLKDLFGSHDLDEDDRTLPVDCNTCVSFTDDEFFHRVLMLSQRLYSLQAVVSHQDSQIELQRASLSERERPGRHRGNVLLEQEKQRNLEKQREELASFQKLQTQHRQEQSRWERECERQRRQAQAAEERLQQREEECRRLEARLAEEREELDRHRVKYQQDLERLRESTRAVEREKERLEQLKKLKKHNSVPSPTLFTQEACQAIPLSSSFNGELGSVGGDHPTLLPKSLVRSSLSVSPADYLERPEVKQPAKVPIHLISTTNQLHKQGAVQQQIPTKLAALSKGGKSSKGRSSHRSDSSASVDMKLMLPLKLSTREDGTLRAKRSVSPHQHQHQLSDPVNPTNTHTEAPAIPPAHSTHTAHKQPLSQSSVANLSPASTEDSSKEDVIYF